MTKKELIEKFEDITSKMDDFLRDIGTLEETGRSILRDIERLPHDEVYIEDDEEDDEFDEDEDEDPNEDLDDELDEPDEQKKEK